MFKIKNPNKVLGQFRCGIFSDQELDQLSQYIPTEVVEYKEFLKKEEYADESEQEYTNIELLKSFLLSVGLKGKINYSMKGIEKLI